MTVPKILERLIFHRRQEIGDEAESEGKLLALALQGITSFNFSQLEIDLNDLRQLCAVGFGGKLDLSCTKASSAWLKILIEHGDFNELKLRDNLIEEVDGIEKDVKLSLLDLRGNPLSDRAVEILKSWVRQRRACGNPVQVELSWTARLNANVTQREV